MRGAITTPLLLLVVVTGISCQRNFIRGTWRTVGNGGGSTSNTLGNLDPSFKNTQYRVLSNLGSRGKVWTFGVGYPWGAYEYINKDGYLRGFSVDIINAVCKKAGRRCNWMADKYSNCWQEGETGGNPGVGLMAGWYDGCMSWLATPLRLGSFNFSQPYTTNPGGRLWYRAGDACFGAIDVPGQGMDLRGKTIGFVSMWAINRNCLNREISKRSGNASKYNTKFYDDMPQLIAALQNREVDAIFATSDLGGWSGSRSGLSSSRMMFQCSTQGMAVMTKYGSPLLSWWNDAFNQMVASGELKRVCDASRTKHGSRGNVWCVA